MSSNKVLILTGSISKSTGGMHSYLYGLCESLLNENINFELCIIDGNNIDTRFNKFLKNIKSFNFIFHRKFYFSPGMFYHVLKSDYSYIYLHGTWASTSILTILKFFFSGTKYIVVPHGMYCGNLTFNKKLGLIWERILVKYSYFVQALNNAEFQCIKILFNFARIRIIYPGLSMSNINDNNATFENLPENYCLYIGQLHPRKNLINMIRAWNLFKTDFRDDVKLVIAGFGDDIYTKSVIKEIELSKDIYYVGPVFGSQKSLLLNNAICSFLFSHSEGLPTSLLESIYSDTPIICSTNCNVSELFDSVDHDFQILLNGDTNQFSICEQLKYFFDLNKDQRNNYLLSLKEDLSRKINWKATVNLFKYEN
jgi:glycosyltransferase involved in cell wall biosynthesis